VSSPLSPDQWQQLESLIDALLDTPPERRAALFAEVSRGDPARRAELERLVAECERVYPLLDTTAAERFATLVHTAPVQISQIVAERYSITRELGHGGMATVFLARDLKHGRDVAIKIIRAEVAAALGGTRFLREIEIAARLRHPNIVPLYDSGEADGVLYYVMPFESGLSLRERLRRDGPLPIDEATAILRDVCDALAYAHKSGVVHRDIKPDNVLLAGRHALVTDFGIAKALSTPDGDSDGSPLAADATTTAAGIMVGTPAYMAPEQASADPRVDRRADLYAFGVLAFEMLAGRPPFSGDVAHEILAAQLSHTPAPVTTFRADVPPALAELISKCLKKRPSDRWQTADEILAELQSIEVPSGALTRQAVESRRWRSHSRQLAASLGLVGVAAATWVLWPNLRGTATAALQTPPALAVLVFDHGTAAELEPLALAITDNLIGALGDIPRLDVRSMRAVWPFRDPRIRLDSVARSLDVPWIVSGRVERRGTQNVVSVQLMDAVNGRQLARRQAVGPLGDDVALVEDLVAKVAVMLRERIGEHVQLARWRSGTRNAKAFADVNRAHRDWRDADLLLANDINGARRLLHRADSTLAAASRADPTWAEPYVQRAWIARRLGFSFGPEGLDPRTMGQALGVGLSHADAALRVSPGDPHALEIRGILLYGLSTLTSKDSATKLLESAERVLTQATNTDSTLARGLNVISAIHFARGELEQARILAVRAQLADAFSDDAYQALARLFQIDFDAGNDIEAVRWCNTFARQAPDQWYPAFCRLLLMMWSEAEAPRAAQARKLAHDATAMAPETIRSSVGAQLQMLYAGVLARLDSASASERVLADVHAMMAADSTITRQPFGADLVKLEAGVRLRLGQRDKAMRMLRRYLELSPGSRDMVARGRPFRGLPIEEPSNRSPSAR
jgi:eukaryotic-like serine/threonine-protein kinase